MGSVEFSTKYQEIQHEFHPPINQAIGQTLVLAVNPTLAYKLIPTPLSLVQKPLENTVLDNHPHMKEPL